MKFLLKFKIALFSGNDAGPETWCKEFYRTSGHMGLGGHPVVLSQTLYNLYPLSKHTHFIVRFNSKT
jgi:hypothetical protein